MSTSYVCPHCQKLHAVTEACKLDDIIRAYNDVTAGQQALADGEETQVTVSYFARRRVVLVTCPYCHKPQGHPGEHGTW